MLPAIFSLAGESLTADERALFADADPAGYILFRRNCRDRSQLRALTDALRELAGRDLPILIDQEGGPVARLGPPEWPIFPAPWRFAELYEKAPISAIEAARANYEAIGILLAEAGITVDCAPLLDLRHAGAHAVIGERSLGDEALQVAALGRAVLDGLSAAGVLGVVKHVPGHGRAGADSHFELPVVADDEEVLEQDFAPFAALRDAPIAMTAHVLFSAWDERRPASCSPTLIAEIIRRRIGFDGLLISDDIGMEALTGTPAERAAAVVAAGCDLALHGSGRLDEAKTIAEELPELTVQARSRLDAAMARREGARTDGEFQALVDKRDALLALV